MAALAAFWCCQFLARAASVEEFGGDGGGGLLLLGMHFICSLDLRLYYASAGRFIRQLGLPRRLLLC